MVAWFYVYKMIIRGNSRLVTYLEMEWMTSDSCFNGAIKLQAMLQGQLCAKKYNIKSSPVIDITF